MMVPSPMSRVETLDNQLAMINSPDALRRLRGYQSMMQRPVIQREEGGLASMMPEDMPMEQPMNPEEAAMQGAEQGMQIAEQVPPEMQEEYAGDVAELKEAARGLAGMGRMGDTELVHMTAEELSGLHSMGQLTYNPVTGLPEAFSLGKIFKKVTSIPRAIVKGVKNVAKSKAFKVLAPIVLGIAAPYALGMTGTAFGFGASTALGTGLGSLLAGQKPSDALKSALFAGVTAGVTKGIGNKLAGGSFNTGQTGASSLQGIKDPSFISSPSYTGQGVADVGKSASISSGITDKTFNFAGQAAPPPANVVSPDKSLLNKLGSKEFYQGIGDKVTSADTYKAIGDRITSPEMYKEMATDFIKRKPDGTINLLGTAGKFGKAIAPTQIGEMAADASAMARAQEGMMSEEEFAALPYNPQFPNYKTYTQKYFQNLNTFQPKTEMAASDRYIASGGGRPMQTAAGGEFSGMVPGDGGGMEDNVFMPIKKGREQVGTLAVSPSEYVVDSYTMAALGGGNAEEGAKVMDKTIEQIREKAYGTPKQPNEIDGIRSLVPLQRSIA